MHLFDLCLRFGRVDTASALAMRGVEGCILEDHQDLGPFSRSVYDPLCDCEGWDTCEYCCWAFPVEQGIWMKDWDVLLDYAIPAARVAAATPPTRAMLDISSRDMELPFSGSPKAMARLLDIAILTGNQKAAINLSKKCRLWPLRRWGMHYNYEDFNSQGWKAARTALWAGAQIQDLMVKDPFHCEIDIPFPKALFLASKVKDWQEIRHLLQGCHDLWRPKYSANKFGLFFFQKRSLDLEKIRAAEQARLDLRFVDICVRCHGDYGSFVVTLLDMAIWYGQPSCAEACVDGGIELKGDDRTVSWHKGILRGESLRLEHPSQNVVFSDAQIAAAAAARACLKRSWKSESSKNGIALYQVMLKMLKGKAFPMDLVQEILTLSMPVPKIIKQLDLWAHVGDWMPSIYCGPSAPASWHFPNTSTHLPSMRACLLDASFAG